MAPPRAPRPRLPPRAGPGGGTAGLPLRRPRQFGGRPPPATRTPSRGAAAAAARRAWVRLAAPPGPPPPLLDLSSLPRWSPRLAGCCRRARTGRRASDLGAAIRADGHACRQRGGAWGTTATATRRPPRSLPLPFTVDCPAPHSRARVRRRVLAGAAASASPSSSLSAPPLPPCPRVGSPFGARLFVVWRPPSRLYSVFLPILLSLHFHPLFFLGGGESAHGSPGSFPLISLIFSRRPRARGRWVGFRVVGSRQPCGGLATVPEARPDRTRARLGPPRRE